jgi:LysM repeat protein
MKRLIPFGSLIPVAILLMSPSAGLSQASADSVKILTDGISANPVFAEYWDNSETFPYEPVTLTDLPEQIVIPLLRKGERFALTWYGKLNSAYKWRDGRQHHGIDLHLKTGDPVYAAFDGIVRYARYNRSGFGNCVVIRHHNGLETVYAHLSRIDVVPNGEVRGGDVIGRGGNTGRSFGPHLHFEVRYKDYSIDPERFIDVHRQRLKTDTLRVSRNSLVTPRYAEDPHYPSRTPGTASGAKSPGATARTAAAADDSASSSSPVSAHADTSVKGGTAPAAEVKPSSVKTSPPPARQEPKKVAKPVGKSPKPSYYTVQKGDNPTSIARKAGVDLATLKKLNPSMDPGRLKPGERLRIR